MVEGGVMIDSNTDAATIDNVESLRQSFHRIFFELLGEEIKITIEPLAANKNVARIFSKSSNSNNYLYVDLDDKKEDIDKWFDNLENSQNNPIVFSDDKNFMIQEMEAWILKQPEAIEEWGRKNRYQRAHSKELIVSHKLICGKNIEDIARPSKTLYNIIQYFFRREKNSSKKIKYGKLKTAPSLLDCLDVIKLKNTDSEIQRFSELLDIKTKV